MLLGTDMCLCSLLWHRFCSLQLHILFVCLLKLNCQLFLFLLASSIHTCPDILLPLRQKDFQFLQTVVSSKNYKGKYSTTPSLNKGSPYSEVHVSRMPKLHWAKTDWQNQLCILNVGRWVWMGWVEKCTLQVSLWLACLWDIHLDRTRLKSKDIHFIHLYLIKHTVMYTSPLAVQQPSAKLVLSHDSSSLSSQLVENGTRSTRIFFFFFFFIKWFLRSFVFNVFVSNFENRLY